MPDLMFGGIVSIEFTRLAAFMMSCLDARASDAGLQASTPGFLVMMSSAPAFPNSWTRTACAPEIVDGLLIKGSSTCEFLRLASRARSLLPYADSNALQMASISLTDASPLPVPELVGLSFW